MTRAWKTTRLKFGARLNPSVPSRIRSLEDDLISFVPMQAIGEDWSLDASRRRPVQELLTGYSYFEDGDLLMAKVTPCFENGKATIATGLTRGSGFGTTEVTVVRVSGFDPRFLFYVINEDGFRQRGVADMTGAGGLKRVPDSTVRDFRVAHPQIDEQGEIADFLDRETGEIDAFIRDQEELIGLLQERRAATISHAVTKGLNPDAPMRETGVPWLGRIPAHWTLNRFSRCVRVNSGQVDPELSPYADMTLIAPNHVEKGTGTLTHLESAREQGAESGKYLVRAGQVIYSKIRPSLAKATLAPVRCLCSADMYGLAGSPGVLNNDFLLWLLLSSAFTDFAVDQSARVAMPKINQDTLGAAPVWYPSIAEQELIAAHIRRETQSLDAAIADAHHVVDLSRERRLALISAAVTGKIDVREHVGV